MSLAALFGGSFLFMRVAAPHFGAIVTAELRVLIAGIVLGAFVVATHRPNPVRAHWKSFVVVGAFNSGVPYALFSYAAIHIPSGYSAILNSLMPIWAAFFAPLLRARIPALLSADRAHRRDADLGHCFPAARLRDFLGLALPRRARDAGNARRLRARRNRSRTRARHRAVQAALIDPVSRCATRDGPSRRPRIFSGLAPR